MQWAVITWVTCYSRGTTFPPWLQGLEMRQNRKWAAAAAFHLHLKETESWEEKERMKESRTEWWKRGRESHSLLNWYSLGSSRPHPQKPAVLRCNIQSIPKNYLLSFRLQLSHIALPSYFSWQGEKGENTNGNLVNVFLEWTVVLIFW